MGHFPVDNRALAVPTGARIEHSNASNVDGCRGFGARNIPCWLAKYFSSPFMPLSPAPAARGGDSAVAGSQDDRDGPLSSGGDDA